MISQIEPITNNYKHLSFMSKHINITKEQVLKLRAMGKNESEIQKELGISLKTYYNKLKQLGISLKSTTVKDEFSKISKEDFENLLKAKTPVNEICKIFKITNSAYYTILEKLGLRHYVMGVNKRAVTKEKLQELVDKQLSIAEICQELNIGANAYYDLIQKFDIKTTYKLNKDRVANITKDDIVNLMEQGKPYPEISKILGISRASLQTLISNYKIKTKNLNTKQIKSTITKEVLESLIKEGKKVSEICKQLNISERQYSELVSKFNIMTKYRQGKANIKNVTQEKLQELVDNGFTCAEICRRLNISESTFYKLLKRLDIRYNYQNHANEIFIPKAKLEQAVKEWTSVEDISNKLNISVTTFYQKAKEAKVKTPFSDAIKAINEVNPKEIQELLDQGIHWKDICKIYNLTETNYHALIRNSNITSSVKKTFQNSQNITKEQLEELINSGKSTKEICKKLNISVMTYHKKLREFGIKRK